MKNKPLKEATFAGCGTCGRTPKLELDKDEGLWGLLSLELDEAEVYSNWTEDTVITARMLENDYDVEFAEVATLHVVTALHEEHYEYDNGVWRLYKQGPGYA